MMYKALIEIIDQQNVILEFLSLYFFDIPTDRYDAAPKKYTIYTEALDTLPGHNQSPHGRLALTSTRPYLKHTGSTSTKRYL